MDIESGCLILELDTGLVWRRDAEAETLEAVGPIFDDDCCPHGLEDHWGYLYDRFDDAARATRGYEASVNAGYYERLGVPGRN